MCRERGALVWVAVPAVPDIGREQDANHTIDTRTKFFILQIFFNVLYLLLYDILSGTITNVRLYEVYKEEDSNIS